MHVDLSNSCAKAARFGYYFDMPVTDKPWWPQYEKIAACRKEKRTSEEKLALKALEDGDDTNDKSENTPNEQQITTKTAPLSRAELKQKQAEQTAAMRAQLIADLAAEDDFWRLKPEELIAAPRPPTFRYDYGPGWAAFRLKVIARSGGVCERCKKARAVHVHHRLPVRYFIFPQDAHFMENALHVCNDCHKTEHDEIRRDLPLLDTIPFQHQRTRLRSQKERRRFIKLRKRANLSQKELALLLGISRQALNQIEKNKVTPHVSTWEKLLALEASYSG